MRTATTIAVVSQKGGAGKTHAPVTALVDERHLPPAHAVDLAAIARPPRRPPKELALRLEARAGNTS